MKPDTDESSPPVQPGSRVVAMTGLAMSATLGTLTARLSKSFAPDWFADAVVEGTRGGDRGARRREILFAVAAAESYLLEWVRDDVLKCDFGRLDRYFIPGNRASIADKWRDIPKQLKPRRPNL